MPYVLLVDDDFDSSWVVASYVRRHGHEVHHVPNGRDALTAVLERVPDLVILDLKMPVMGGIEFLEVLRSYLRLAGLPVVLLTGYADEELIDRARGLGVREVFVKGEPYLAALVEWMKHHATS